MIKINLLPSEAGKRAATSGAQKQKSPKSAAMPFYLLLALLYIGSLGGAYWVYDQGAQSAAALKKKQTEKANLARKVENERKRLMEASKNSREIEEKYEVAMALSPRNRVFWSEKINMLSRARMDLAVYVTKLVLTEKIDEIETPESVKRREEWKNSKRKDTEPEPKPIKRPIINQTLHVEAIAYGNDDPQRLRQIVAFQEALNKLKWQRVSNDTVRFMDGLNPEFVQLPQKRDVVGGVEVMRFGFECNAEPQMESTAPVPTPGAPAAKGGN